MVIPLQTRSGRRKTTFGSRYLRMDQVKFVEDSV